MFKKASIILGIILAILIILISTLFFLQPSYVRPQLVSLLKERLGLKNKSKPPPKGILTVNAPLDISDVDTKKPKLLMTRSFKGGTFGLEAKTNKYFYILDGLAVKRISLKGKIETIYERHSGYELGGVAVDKDENVYIGIARREWNGREVPFVKDPEIKVFSSQRKLLKTMKMPGEAYVKPKISAKGKLFVSNLHVHLGKAKKAVYVFDLKGKLIKKVRFRGSILDYGIDKEENLYFGSQISEGAGKDRTYKGISFKKLNLEGEVLKEVFIKTDENFPGFRFGFYGIDNQGYIYVGFGEAFEDVDLRKYDIEGNLIKRFTLPPRKGEFLYEGQFIYIIPNGEVYLLYDYKKKDLKLYYLGK